MGLQASIPRSPFWGPELSLPWLPHVVEDRKRKPGTRARLRCPPGVTGEMAHKGLPPLHRAPFSDCHST